MTELRVFDLSSTGRRVALQERQHVYHVAFTPLDHIPIHHRVSGDPVRVGLCTMYDMDVGRPVTLLFEQIGCNLWEALELLEKC
jgi:hypothetical protein